MTDTPSPTVEGVVGSFRTIGNGVGRFVVDIMSAFETASQQHVGLVVIFDEVQSNSRSLRNLREGRDCHTVTYERVTQCAVAFRIDVEQFRFNAFFTSCFDPGDTVVVVIVRNSRLFILEQSRDRVGVGDRIRRPYASFRVLCHSQSILFVQIRGVQEERILKLRIRQLVVVYIVRSLVVDQVLPIQQCDLPQVGGLRSIERIHTVGNFVGTDCQQQAFQIIIGVDLISSIAIFLCNFHVNNRTSVREDCSGRTGNHVNFATDFCFFPSRFRQSSHGLRHVSIQEVFGQFQEASLLNLLFVVAPVCSVDQVNGVAARHDQRILLSTLSRRNEVQINGSIDRRFDFLIRSFHYFFDCVGLARRYVHNNVLFFAQVDVRIRIITICRSTLSAAVVSRLALWCAGGCGVVTASQKQGEHHHNRHQKCEFLHMYPPR